MCLFSCLFLHFINSLIAYSLFNAGSWNMGKGKADGVGFLRKVVGLPSRSGRACNPPPRLLDDDSSQGGRGRGAPRGGGGGGRASRGRGAGGRATTGGRGQKERTLTDLGVLSSRPSSCFVHDCRNSIEFSRSTGAERTRSCYANARNKNGRSHELNHS